MHFKNKTWIAIIEFGSHHTFPVLHAYKYTQICIYNVLLFFIHKITHMYVCIYNVLLFLSHSGYYNNKKMYYNLMLNCHIQYLHAHIMHMYPFHKKGLLVEMTIKLRSIWILHNVCVHYTYQFAKILQRARVLSLWDLIMAVPKLSIWGVVRAILDESVSGGVGAIP